MSSSVTLLIARVLLSAIFIMAGLQKFGGIEGTAGYIGSVGLPAGAALAWLSAIFETLVGLAILVGFQTRAAAFLLAIFCIFVGLVFHFRPGDMMQMMILQKDLAIAGGFMVLAVAGAGAYSVDARTGRQVLA